MKNKNVSRQDQQEYIPFSLLLCSINPAMSPLEEVIHVSTCGKIVHYRKNDNVPCLEIEDAIAYIQELRNGSKGDFIEFYEAILDWLNDCRKSTNIPPINIETYPHYCKAFIKVRPEVASKKEFIQYYLQGDNSLLLELSPSDLPKGINDEGYVYFILSPLTHRIRIGFSKDIETRLSTILTHSPDDKVTLLTKVPGNRSVETLLHKKFNKYHIHSDWFEFHPEIESFVNEIIKQKKE